MTSLFTHFYLQPTFFSHNAIIINAPFHINTVVPLHTLVTSQYFIASPRVIPQCMNSTLFLPTLLIIPHGIIQFLCWSLSWSLTTTAPCRLPSLYVSEPLPNNERGNTSYISIDSNTLRNRFLILFIGK